MIITPNPTDPVSATIDSLASARWTREPDWRTFQEKLVNTRTPRFQFLRTRPVLFASIAALALCGGAAAVVKVYDLLHFTGTATLSDGSTVQVEGDIVLDGDSWTATATADTSANAGVTQMDVTLTDGTVTRIVTTQVDEHGMPIKTTPDQPAPGAAPAK